MVDIGQKSNYYLSNKTNKNKKGMINMSKFKIGDKVKLRDDLKVGEKYEGVLFLSGMKDLQGKELTINYISEGDYTFEESVYYCSGEMLEKVF